MKQKIKIFVFLLSFCSAKVMCQDINFSQFYELPLLRNPALAGLYKGDVRATAAFRSQWQSVTTPYVTQALGLEFKFAARQNSNNYVALGLQMTNDQAGDSKLGKTQLLPVVTFHKALSEDKDSYISLGFIGGMVQQRFDVSKLSFNDQFVNGSYSEANPTKQVFNNTNVTYFDGSVGLVFSSTIGESVKYYIGGSWFHFNAPRVAFDVTKDVKLNSKYMVNAGLSTPTGEYDKITLYVDYFKQGGNNQTQGGLIYTHDLLRQDEDESISISAGSFIRWNDAVIPVVKLDYYKLGIGVTYDVNISKLALASKARGGFEITLSYRNFLNMRNSSLEKTRCPVQF
jgi:type IX secretion system PorP/SprF family membrane protein